jgi:hypothetical protein
MVMYTCVAFEVSDDLYAYKKLSTSMNDFIPFSFENKNKKVNFWVLYNSSYKKFNFCFL